MKCSDNDGQAPAPTAPAAGAGTVEKPVRIDIVRGVEGPAIYLNNFRIDGPKPWGGGKIIMTFLARPSEIRQQFDQFDKDYNNEQQPLTNRTD